MFQKKKNKTDLNEQKQLIQALKTQKEQYTALSSQYTHALDTLKAKHKEAEELLLELRKLHAAFQPEKEDE